MIRLGAEDTLRELARTESNINAAARQVLDQGSAYALELAQRTTTFHDRTGRLRASMKRGQRSNGTRFVQAGGGRAYYGAFLEDGTRYIDARYFMRDARNWAESKVAQFIESGMRSAVHA